MKKRIYGFRGECAALFLLALTAGVCEAQQTVTCALNPIALRSNMPPTQVQIGSITSAAPVTVTVSVLNAPQCMSLNSTTFSVAVPAGAPASVTVTISTGNTARDESAVVTMKVVSPAGVKIECHALWSCSKNANPSVWCTAAEEVSFIPGEGRRVSVVICNSFQTARNFALTLTPCQNWSASTDANQPTSVPAGSCVVSSLMVTCLQGAGECDPKIELTVAGLPTPIPCKQRWKCDGTRCSTDYKPDHDSNKDCGLIFTATNVKFEGPRNGKPRKKMFLDNGAWRLIVDVTESKKKRSDGTSVQSLSVVAQAIHIVAPHPGETTGPTIRAQVTILSNLNKSVLFGRSRDADHGQHKDRMLLSVYWKTNGQGGFDCYDIKVRAGHSENVVDGVFKHKFSQLSLPGIAGPAAPIVPRISTWGPTGWIVSVGTSIFVLVENTNPTFNPALSQSRPMLMVGTDSLSAFAGSIDLPYDLTTLGLPGYWLLVDPLLVIPGAPPNGNHHAEVRVDVPDDPTLVGRRLLFQWFMDVPSANGPGIALTEAAEIVIVP